MDQATIQQKPIIALREFFSTTSRPVQMAEFQEFWKTLAEDEKESYRQAIQKWEGESHFIKN